MCRKFILASSLEAIEKSLNVLAPVRLEWNPNIVVSPGDNTLIITQQSQKELTLSTFGMTPAWAKLPMQLTNARAEGNKNPDNNPSYNGSKAIFMKPSFKRPLVSQRCIVVADAYFEWSAISKQPFLVYLQKKQRPFGMAGMYDIWKNPDSGLLYHSFSIITVPGNMMMHQLPAARMPVILPRGKETDWLRASNHLSMILGMLEPYPADKMNAYPVSRNIDLPGPSTKAMLLPVGDKLYREADPPPMPQRRYGHKQKGAGSVAWGEKTGHSN